ncbi:MAG: hypothetical protein GX654_11420 [Desulfatiglans sp.]|nr:hypothetical protein [Desulfatiglans sp.]
MGRVMRICFLLLYSHISEYAVKGNGERVLLKNPMEIKRGELVRIDLFLSILDDKKNRNQKMGNRK